MIKNTPEDHPDYQPLQIAFDLFNFLVDKINQQQRKEGAKLKVLEISSILKGYPVCYLNFKFPKSNVVLIGEFITS